MLNRKGFSLTEIIMALIIVGVLAAMAIPNYINTTMQGTSNAAQNNLLSIYTSEKNFYFNNNYWCSTVGANPNCGLNVTNINAGLGLNITDTKFSYQCTADGFGYHCIATSLTDPLLSLTLENQPIVMLGGAGCATSAGAGCNPSCASDNMSFCPTS